MSKKNKQTFYEWLMKKYPNPEWKDIGGESAYEDFAYTIKHDDTFPTKSTKFNELEEYFKRIKKEKPDYNGGWEPRCAFDYLWEEYTGIKSFYYWLSDKYFKALDKALEQERPVEEVRIFEDDVENEFAEVILNDDDFPHMSTKRKEIDEYLAKAIEKNNEYFGGFEPRCMVSNLWAEYKEERATKKSSRFCIKKQSETPYPEPTIPQWVHDPII